MTINIGRFKAGPRFVRLTALHLEALAAELRAFGITTEAAVLLARLNRSLVQRPHLEGRADDPQR